MTIATKNGSVIIKSGSVAQNCGCCGICEPFIAISIIDEDSDYSPARRRDDDWNCFRAAFPSSPFFLLVPKRGAAFDVQLPAAWDGTKYNVSRDDGVVANATDYYSLLGLESLLALYDRIVLVVDNSGSMTSGTVLASLNMLYSQLESQHGINEANGSLVRFNVGNENWIDPFANICRTPSGATGACCNGTTCSIKPQCQCNAAAGEVFKGVGTVCSPNPCCECSDNAPLSVFATIQNMDQIGGFYGPGGAAALRSLLVGNTYEMTRPYLNPSTFVCRPFFLYESSAASCGASACTNSVASIRLSLTPTGALPQNVPANVPISPNYVLLLEAWATNPCVFTYGRQGVSTGVFGTFSMRATELVCSGGSAVVEVWNACAPGIQNWFKNADILLEW